MAAPILYGEILGISYNVIFEHMCVRMHACTCMCMGVGGTLIPPHTQIQTPFHPPWGGGTPGISKNSITLELIEIFQFCLKI